MKKTMTRRTIAFATAFLLLLASPGGMRVSAEYTTNIDAGSVIINGMTVPLAVYPVGNYYTDNGEACPNHDDDGMHLNCKDYDVAPGTNWPEGGYQCQAFGMEAFKLINGFDVTEDREYAGMTVSTSTEFKNFMKSIPVGSMVRMRIAYSQVRHTFVLMRCDDTGVYAYHANWYNRCKITTNYWTFDAFNQEYGEVVYYVAGCSHTYSYSNKTTTSHTATCTECGYSKTEAHTWTENVIGRIVCSVCGYQSNNFVQKAEDEHEAA